MSETPCFAVFFEGCFQNLGVNGQPLNLGCRKRSAAKGVRSLFFRFRDAFGHFSVIFSDASVAFFVTFLPNSFCRTPFAAG